MWRKSRTVAVSVVAEPAVGPEGLAENFLAGRMADGSRIGDNPVLAQVLAQIAGAIEPGRTLVVTLPRYRSDVP